MSYRTLNLRYVVKPLANLAATRQLRLGKVVVVLLSLLLATPITALCQQDVSNTGEVITLEQAIALALRENHLCLAIAGRARRSQSPVPAGPAGLLDGESPARKGDGRGKVKLTQGETNG